MEANTWLWILGGFRAALLLGPGVLKRTRSRDETIAEGLACPLPAGRVRERDAVAASCPMLLAVGALGLASAQ